MSTRPYHRRYHSDALAGFMSLTLEERGAYQTLLDLMYDRQGPLIDNDRLLAGYMGVSIRKWRSLRESLIAKGKINIDETGLISNFRVKKELENDAKTSRKRAENGLKGSRKKSENQKNTNDNNDGEEILPKQNSSYTRATPYPESREEEKEEERIFGSKEEETPPLDRQGKPYAVAGTFVKINRKDFDEYRRTYHAVRDVAAELLAYDGWLKGQPETKQKKWWGGVAAWLNRRHQELLERADQAAEAKFLGPC